MAGKPKYARKRGNFTIAEIARVATNPEQYTLTYLQATYAAAAKRIKPCNRKDYSINDRFICSKAATIIKQFIDTRYPTETGILKYTKLSIKQRIAARHKLLNGT